MKSTINPKMYHLLQGISMMSIKQESIKKFILGFALLMGVLTSHSAYAEDLIPVIGAVNFVMEKVHHGPPVFYVYIAGQGLVLSSADAARNVVATGRPVAFHTLNGIQRAGTIVRATSLVRGGLIGAAAGTIALCGLLAADDLRIAPQTTGDLLVDIDDCIQELESIFD